MAASMTTKREAESTGPNGCDRDRLIPLDHMGEVWPAAQPGRSGSEYGSASLSPQTPVEIRSCQTIVLTYTVGMFGLDDTGGIKVVQRFTNDGGRWQTDVPTARNYVTARASNGCRLTLLVEPFGHQRPWDRSLRIVVNKGSMRRGDRIEVIFGDRSRGSPGLRMQTFSESAHEFRVLVDACATGHFFPLPDRPCITVVAGKPDRWHAVLPTRRSPGASFTLGIRADDIWGNPTGQIEGCLRLKGLGAIMGLPETAECVPGQRSLRIEGLWADTEGEVAVEVHSDTGQLLVRSNPLIVARGPYQAFWGDLHGQSGETVGVNSIEEYFEFARDLAFLDVSSHQANDFQITNAFWQRLNEVTAAFNEDGQFVAIPGYEWSGNTPTGGDHNVFFRHEGRPLVRSSHALVAERRDLDRDANTSGALFDALSGEDCVICAHIGGRPADLGQADGKALRTSVEVHSNWGTFEWLMAENFKLGHRHGLVCNSDVHKGRPGASHPGASEFGAYGGLTCFLAERLARDSIFRSLRSRHHYGTTGCRLDMDIRMEFERPARVFETDPRLGPANASEASHAMMGDIVETTERSARLRIEIAGQAPILRIDVLNASEILRTRLGYLPDARDARLRVLFHGAEYRGRGRQTRWHGSAVFRDARIEGFRAINKWNHDRVLRQESEQSIVFDVLTTGNFVGFDACLSECSGGLDLRSDHVDALIDLGSIGEETLELDAGGLERRVSVARLPAVCRETRISEELDIALDDGRDNPIWVRVHTEDGHVAWSSPIYVFRSRRGRSRRR